MNILVTGATGLVGSVVSRLLIERGHSVTALARKGANLNLVATIATKVKWVEGDILDIISVEAAMEQIDYVVHAAAIVSFVPRDRAQMFKVNQEGTANIVNACLKFGVNKLCHISSIAAIGRPNSRKVIAGAKAELNEEQRWEDSPENSEYAKSKHLAELEVWRGIAEGLQAVIVNPTLILGEGDWQKSSTQIFRYIYQEKPFYTEGLANYVDVTDVAEIVYQLLFSPVSGERFLLNAGSITYKDLFYMIADAMNKKRPKYKVGKNVASIIWRVEALRTFILGTKPLITKETAQSSARNITYNNSKIVDKLGFQFTPIMETVRRVSESLLRSV